MFVPGKYLGPLGHPATLPRDVCRPVRSMIHIPFSTVSVFLSLEVPGDFARKGPELRVGYGNRRYGLGQIASISVLGPLGVMFKALLVLSNTSG